MFSYISLFLLLSSSLFAQKPIKYIAFSTISVYGNVNILLVKAEGPSGFTAEMANGSLDDLKIESNGTILKMGIPNNSKTGRNNARAEIVVYYNHISDITAKSGAKVTGSSVIEAENIDLFVSYESSISMECNANIVSVNASSKGKCNLRGKVEKLLVEAMSAARVNSAELVATNSIVSAASAANVSVNTTHELVANTASGGTIKYTAKPEVLSKNKDNTGGQVSQL